MGTGRNSLRVRLSQPDRERLERAAAELVDRLPLDDRDEISVPIDVRRIATGALTGRLIRVVELDLARAGLLPNGMRRASGAFHFRRGKIFVQEGEVLYRQRFTIAHELAHVTLANHERLLGGGLHFVYAGEDGIHSHGATPGNDISDTRLRHLELEADEFAANLLMPRRLIESWVAREGPCVPSLAERFGVSCQAMQRRLSADWMPTHHWTAAPKAG